MADEKPYETGEWKGHPLYRCQQCAWDCLDDEALMITHIQKEHMPKPQPRMVLVADKSGHEKVEE